MTRSIDHPDRQTLFLRVRLVWNARTASDHLLVGLHVLLGVIGAVWVIAFGPNAWGYLLLFASLVGLLADAILILVIARDDKNFIFVEEPSRD